MRSSSGLSISIFTTRYLQQFRIWFSTMFYEASQSLLESLRPFLSNTMTLLSMILYFIPCSNTFRWMQERPTWPWIGDRDAMMPRKRLKVTYWYAISAIEFWKWVGLGVDPTHSDYDCCGYRPCYHIDKAIHLTVAWDSSLQLLVTLMRPG